MAELIYIGKQSKIVAVAEHSHQWWEIICYTQGIGNLTFEGGGNIPYQKGSIVIIPPNIKHSNHSLHGFTNIYMHVSDCAYIRSPRSLSDNSSSTIYHLMKQLLVMSSATEKNLPLVTVPLTDLILNLILEFMDARPMSPYVEEIKDKLVENFAVSSFSVKDCLADIPHNSEYLRQLFTKETGKTPTQFLTSVRLDNAKRLLSLRHINNLTVEEIASMCGFSDPLYFSRVFKKHTSLSPRAYADKKRG